MVTAFTSVFMVRTDPRPDQSVIQDDRENEARG
ncbi:hypothetical protein HD597_005178 [Nonomuraea thailandensis]|uniref:Uncharacterized protein n=1 Tax=Nonomuraea thailandensis TaxID=1188745 RepID=A0A9X2GNZ8_9ACTN|nr:hypothetical protein [Nonomuraea thailandensis]